MKPLRYGITGGIGSGKSYVCHLLAKTGAPIFYCDDVAKRIIREDPAVRRLLTDLVGPETYDAEGRLRKSVLAAWLCRGRDASAQVDAIVHPRVAEAFRRWADSQHAAKVYMECALLWESGFDRLVDYAVLVYAPDDVRLRRIMKRDGISADVARRWMALQLSEEEKRRRADIIIPNGDGAKPDLSHII